jgi:hypothetical protein
MKWLLQLITIAASFATDQTQRLYNKQFELSRSFTLPKILHFSIYMGKLHYTYFPLTLESMKHNSNVTFVLINVIEDFSNQADEMLELIRTSEVKNFKAKVITIVSLTKSI